MNKAAAEQPKRTDASPEPGKRRTGNVVIRGQINRTPESVKATSLMSAMEKEQAHTNSSTISQQKNDEHARKLAMIQDDEINLMKEADLTDQLTGISEFKVGTFAHKIKFPGSANGTRTLILPKSVEQRTQTIMQLKNYCANIEKNSKNVQGATSFEATPEMRVTLRLNQFYSPTLARVNAKLNEETLSEQSKRQILDIQKELAWIKRAINSDLKAIWEDISFFKEFEVIKAMVAMHNSIDKEIRNAIIMNVEMASLDALNRTLDENSSRRISVNQDIESILGMENGAPQLIQHIANQGNEATLSNVLKARNKLQNSMLDYSKFSNDTEKPYAHREAIDAWEKERSQYIILAKTLADVDQQYQPLVKDAGMYLELLANLERSAAQHYNNPNFKKMQTKFDAIVAQVKEFTHTNERHEMTNDDKYRLLVDKLIAMDTEINHKYSSQPRGESRHDIINQVNTTGKFGKGKGKGGKGQANSRGAESNNGKTRPCVNVLHTGNCEVEGCKARGLTREQWAKYPLCRTEMAGQKCHYGNQCFNRHKTDKYEPTNKNVHKNINTTNEVTESGMSLHVKMDEQGEFIVTNVTHDQDVDGGGN